MPVLLQINSVANRGSTGRIAESLGLYAKQHGWDSYMAYGRPSNESGLESIKIGNQASIVAHALRTLLFDTHGLGSAYATKRLISKLKVIKPDIIHLHNIHGYYLNYPILFQYLASLSVPVIWTLHDCWSFTGHCTYFSDIDCSKWKLECYECPKKGNYPRSLLKDRSRKNYQLKKYYFNQVSRLKIITVSDWLRGLIRQSFLSQIPVQTIHNGVDTSVFVPGYDLSDNYLKKYSLSEKFVLVAASTSWAKQKGFEDYLELSKHLKEDEVIVLIGLPPEKIRKLPANILGLPRTESVEELAAWYGLADVVLNLSYQESFGLTTVEGFSCGTPSIVYNATASPELFLGEKLGYVVPPGDISKVLKAKNRIRKNSKAYYSPHCRSEALAKFDQRKQLGKYIGLYKEMLGR